MDNPFATSSFLEPSNGEDALAQVPSLLFRLRRLIKTLRVSQTTIPGAEKVRKELKEANRALTIINLLQDRYLIAVAGPQGAGKSTTLKRLYGIPDGFLPIDVGTGERIPVAVVEHDSNNFEPYVFLYNPEDEETHLKPLSGASECNEVVAHPGANDVMVELRVPKRFFESSGEGFLLLPGIESSNAVHVQLARHVLPIAATALICVDDKQIARASVNDEIGRIQQEMNTAESRLIFALTKVGKEEKKEEAIRTLQERFDINDTDRIVPISHSHHEQGEYAVPEWHDDLVNAVGKYGKIIGEQRRKEYEQLDRLVYKVDCTLSELQEKISLSIAEEAQSKDEHVEPIMRSFDKANDDQRDRLDHYLEDTLNNHSKEASNKVEGEIIEDSIPEKIKKYLFQKGSLRGRIEFKKLLKNHWKSIHPTGPSALVFDALNKTAGEKLPRRNGLPTLLDAQSTEDFIGTFVQPDEEERGEGTSNNSEELIVDSKMLNDIEYLMRPNSEVRKASEDLRYHVRAVPALALEAMRFVSIKTQPFSNTDTRAFKDELPPENHHLKDHFEETQGQGRYILKGVLLTLGADVIPDGEFGVLQGIWGAVSGGAAAASGPALAVAAGGILTAYSAVAVTKSIRQDEIERSDAAEAAFEHMARKTRQNVLAEYDRYMDRVREALSDNLRKRYNLDISFADRSNVRSAVAQVQKSLRAIEKDLPVGL